MADIQSDSMIAHGWEAQPLERLLPLPAAPASTAPASAAPASAASTTPAPTAPAGLFLDILSDVQAWQCMVGRDNADALTRCMQQELRFAMPAAGMVHHAQGRHGLWLGPDQCLVLGPARDTAMPAAMSALAAAGMAVSEQSDARLIVECSGPRLRDFLARVIMLDLDDAPFPNASTANTMMDHTPVQIYRWDAPASDTAPRKRRYRIAIPASFGQSIWGYMGAVGAQFGLAGTRKAFD